MDRYWFTGVFYLKPHRHHILAKVKANTRRTWCGQPQDTGAHAATGLVAIGVLGGRGLLIAVGCRAQQGRSGGGGSLVVFWTGDEHVEATNTGQQAVKHSLKPFFFYYNSSVMQPPELTSWDTNRV